MPTAEARDRTLNGAPISARGSVVLDSVTKYYRHRPALFNWLGRERGGCTEALRDVSLSAAPGEVLVLLGPNGSGKTTLLKLVSTMLLPDRGRILVNGLDAAQQAGEVCAGVGFAVATERSFVARLTARENLLFFAALENIPRTQRRPRIEQALAAAGLTPAADTLVMKFSSGMHQRLGLARALLKQPSVLLLDEPTRSLDPGAALRFWKLVRETAARGATILLATHSFDEAVAVGHSVAILRRGTLLLHQPIERGTTVEEMRAFYFRQAEEEAAEPAAAGSL